MIKDDYFAQSAQFWDLCSQFRELIHKNLFDLLCEVRFHINDCLADCFTDPILLSPLTLSLSLQYPPLDPLAR